ncbi:hypothetical protein P170DRAFT_448236 [Aspergillus steynii IBT 23096]|uniref:N-acetylgalactosaminide beta-1,3-galactosyltransferase n=1 Tax=Aspergillus steynii IBT 23096 TaxID=1392250 RepID=A0A2I2G6R0_9EURO|nr:uncharacterized protein P170DRAFT_448236 [Aspergillus steynii IBT 23096]PLB48564.1 hypothetical protein P170DRAFT_448236 [Aspergillus steynii IBT 23096]
MGFAIFRTSGPALWSPNTAAAGCHPVYGMDDVLVILKTGATVALDKVPMHVQTTLRCVPHYAVFSDFEEDIQDVHTLDVLRSVSNHTKGRSPDFGLYNRLHALGRLGLLAEDWNDDDNGPFGKPGNPSWKLDKWKFVPMLDEALRIRPDARWYVFIEADSYIIWPNLMAWLSGLNHTHPQYLGAPMQSGEVFFAYGGSGIVLSNPAVRRVSKYRAENPVELEELTARHWAGDCVLGEVIQAVHIPFIWSWPMLQGARVWEADLFTERYGRKPWCYPAVSYHHMSQEDIQNMWDFERQWFATNQDSKLPLLHKDTDWDNLSADNADDSNDNNAITTYGDCAQQCARNAGCLQFSFGDAACFTSSTVIWGTERPGYRSGWMDSHIQATLEHLDCPEANYIIE